MKRPDPVFVLMLLAIIYGYVGGYLRAGWWYPVVLGGPLGWAFGRFLAARKP